MVHAGGTIRIIAYVSGKPAPQITWCRDDGEVPKEAAVEKTGISNSLVIKNCRRQHQGIYTLSAKNEGGERKKAVIVEVLGESACLRCFKLLLVNTSDVITSGCVLCVSLQMFLDRLVFPSPARI